jgi:hypothetical protein
MCSTTRACTARFNSCALECRRNRLNLQHPNKITAGEKGKRIIGAVNYLASAGANAFSFLTYNYGGDGSDVWPLANPTTRDRYDVSKLDQWEVLFSHADALGMFLHFKTQVRSKQTNKQANKQTKIHACALIYKQLCMHAAKQNDLDQYVQPTLPIPT